MSEDEFDTPSDQGRTPCGPRRRVVRNGASVSPNRRHRPRTKPPGPPDPPPPVTPSTDAQPLRRGTWLRYLWFRPGAGAHNTAIAVAWIGCAGVLGAGLIPVTTAVAGSLFGERGSGGAPSRRVATIVHAPGGETYAYVYPSLSSEQAKPRGIYREGDTIEVVCQIRDGEPVSNPGDGRPNFAVSAWNQLANGSWVSDVYTSLGSKRGPNPPPGITLCPDHAPTVPAP